MPSSPKISIIIPVYNAEMNLKASLESAIQQTLEEIEILCINDCSNYSSDSFLLKISNIDKRLCIIEHDKNRGIGAAKNTGLECAKGEYIFYLHPGDILPPNALELLYIQADKFDSELVKGRYSFLHEGGEIEHLYWSTPDSKIINSNIYTSEFLQKIPTCYQTYIYNRKFLNSYNIKHRTDLVDSEDLIFIATALQHAKTVTLIPGTVYFHYLPRSSGVRGRVSITEAKDAIKTKIIIADMLNKLGLITAATSYLQSWDYIIHTQWKRIAFCLTTDECKQIFTDFRSKIKPKKIIPWVTSTEQYHRHILALVLTNRDEDALSFLRTNEALTGFSSQANLISSLKLVQAQFPNDIGALSKLGHLIQRNGGLKEALHIFNEIIKYESNNYDANFQSAIILKHLGRTEEDRNRVNTLLKIITQNIQYHNVMEKALALKEDLIRIEISPKLNKETEKLNKLQIKLDQSYRELNLAYTSKSWRITKPLRKISAIIKRINI